MKKTVLLPLVLALAGCGSGELNRSTAERKILERFPDGPNNISVKLGRVGLHCISQDYQTGKERDRDLVPSHNEMTMVAIKAGYVTATPDSNGYWKVDLTPKGRAAADPKSLSDTYRNQLGGCNFSEVEFTIAQTNFVRVTGISGPNTAPEVDFQWKWTATELGRLLIEDGTISSSFKADEIRQLKSLIAINTPGLKVPIPLPAAEMTETATLTFKKYDDGWRIAE